MIPELIELMRTPCFAWGFTFGAIIIVLLAGIAGVIIFLFYLRRIKREIESIANMAREEAKPHEEFDRYVCEDCKEFFWESEIEDKKCPECGSKNIEVKK